MHIADGIMSNEVAAAAYAVSLAGVWVCGRKVDPLEVPRLGMVAAAAFAASLFHFPVGGTSVHLGLFGLVGVMLGRRAFPVIFATLLFQALIFQHGGLLKLGLNALNMGAGAVAGWWLWRARAIPETGRAFLAGFLGILIPAFLMAAEFSLSGYGKGFYFIAAVYSITAAIEGLVTIGVVTFVRRVKPAILAPA
jgi:cobalt/nickel transport system permease protein